MRHFLNCRNPTKQCSIINPGRSLTCNGSYARLSIRRAVVQGLISYPARTVKPPLSGLCMTTKTCPDNQEECIVPENIHTSPRWFFFICLNLPPPSGNSSLGSYFPLKILAFKIPLLLRISNDPLWWGYRYFLEPHNE